MKKYPWEVADGVVIPKVKFISDLLWERIKHIDIHELYAELGRQLRIASKENED